MKTSGISFGNNPGFPANHKEMQNKAYTEIWKHFKETGNYCPVKIDYFVGREPRITYLNDVSKPNSFILKCKNLLKRIFKR